MNPLRRLVSGLLTMALFASFCHASERAPLNLDGYAEPSGAIVLLHDGDFVDPYFAMQALLLAHENGLDISRYSEKWLAWLIERQKLDATFDRHCRAGPTWVGCKQADADDSLLALFLKLFDAMPARLKENSQWLASHEKSETALNRLRDPTRGIYLVSPVFQHGLFMDNLEVWSHHAARSGPAHAAASDRLARAVHAAFWDDREQRFLVSTQPEQKSLSPTFYPEHVAQIFPLLFQYPKLPLAERTYYRRWMRNHRAEWLAQTHTDFAWGLLAVLAWRHADIATARCWLRETTPYRHSSHWTVTDEAAHQILLSKGLKPAAERAACN
jgi:hypothetical protein